MDYKHFENKYDVNLDNEQREAILNINDNVLLLAVPGSGKTTTMITRLGYMTIVLGVDPTSILAITFTNKATEEMEKRFSDKFGFEIGKLVTFCTINSLCFSIVKESYGVYPDVIKDSERNRILRKLFERYFDREPNFIELSELSNMITRFKNSVDTELVLSSKDSQSDLFIIIYNDYQNELKKRDQIDYDDQLIIADKVLSEDKELLHRLRKRYKYVCVDEAQDTSELQHKIIRAIVGNNHVFMVGDEDQSIYGFRGAKPEYLLSFDDKYFKGKTFTLANNYRSDVIIVEKTKKFIDQNTERYTKNMIGKTPEHGEMLIEKTGSRTMQYYSAFEQIRKAYNKSAVLYRNNLSGIPLMYVFERNNIDYSIGSAAEEFFKTARIGYIIHTLMFALKPNNIELYNLISYKYQKLFPYDITKRALSRLNRKNQFFDLLLDEMIKYEYKDSRHSSNCRTNIKDMILMLKTIPELSSIDAINRIISFDRQRKSLKVFAPSENEMEVLCFLAEQASDLRTFIHYFERIKGRGTNDQNKIKNIHLSTIHSAKGMEFDDVYLVDCIDGILPSVNNTSKKELDEEFKQIIEEERRVFYVGMTRAKKKLIIYRIAGEHQLFVDELKKLGVHEYTGKRYEIPNTALEKEDKTAIDYYSDYSDSRTIKRLYRDFEQHDSETKTEDSEIKENRINNLKLNQKEKTKHKAIIVARMGSTTVFRTTEPIRIDVERRRKIKKKQNKKNKKKR